MHAKTIEGYDLWFRLEERSFCFKRLVEPPEGVFPRKRRHNAIDAIITYFAHDREILNEFIFPA